ncbi:MAG: DNA-binding domain-containing protein [Verrucomicrobiota bacterium]
MPKRQTISELRDLQRRVAQVVMRPLVRGDRIDPVGPDERPTAHIAADLIRPGRRHSSLERLEIYNRQYWFRLLECMDEDYPGLRAVLGDRLFSKLARDYLAAHPSESFTLRNLGQSLVQFIDANPDRLGSRQALARDVARLEWAHVEAFDNAAEPPLSVDELRGTDPGRLRLRLQPYLTLLDLNHRLDDFLIRVRRGIGLRAEASQARSAPIRRRAVHIPIPPCCDRVFLAVHRQKGTVFYKRLRAEQFTLLTALHRGMPLAKACSVAMESPGAKRLKPDAISTWFRDWSALGWFWRNQKCA